MQLNLRKVCVIFASITVEKLKINWIAHLQYGAIFRYGVFWNVNIVFQRIIPNMF